MKACLPLLAALAFATPALTQDTQGPCTDGTAWWSGDGQAGLGPCDLPRTGLFTLACAGGAPTLAVRSPYPIAPGQRGTVDLTVDGTSWRLEGRGTSTDGPGRPDLGEVIVPTDAIAALRDGSRARLDMPSETHPFHLTGSGAALAALPC